MRAAGARGVHIGSRSVTILGGQVAAMLWPATRAAMSLMPAD